MTKASAIIPDNEANRLEAVKRFGLLDTPPDGSFDQLTALAATIFNVPICIISLVDSDRIWFKSHYGLNVNQIDREPGLCASAILSGETYIIENAIEDPRSLANPLVAGEFGLRFYAAVPLQTDDFYNLGTFCIIDKEPRKLSDNEKSILKQLADLVMNEMEKRLALRNLTITCKNLVSDISVNLKSTIKNLESSTMESQKEKVISYLDSSDLYLQNLQNKLSHL